MTTHTELLSIGAELLLGETVDTNAAFLGAEMADIGLPFGAARMLADDRELIAAAFREARRRSGVVLATGGLGPTHDDLTREGLADALGEELHEDAGLIGMLDERFGVSGAMPATNRRQALLVPSATAIANPIGSAPGWWVDRDGSVVVLMPGVPSEMRKMWTEQVRPRLEERFATRPLRRRIVKSFGMGESAVAERLGTLLSDPPDGVDAGIYARDDGVHVRYSSLDPSAPLDDLVARSVKLLGEVAYGTDDDELASAALARLAQAGAETVASWEADSAGSLIGVLSGAPAGGGRARYVGGVLDAGTPSGPPIADAVIQLMLMPQDAHGRSRVRVAVSGVMTVAQTELRIHGSGPQRLRRAAFAALDLVRRSDSSDR